MGCQEHALRQQRDWTVAEDLQVLGLKSMCKWNEKNYGVPYQIDHVLPIKGHGFSGLDLPINMAVIPASRNRSKKNLMPLGCLDLFHDPYPKSERLLNGCFAPLPPMTPAERMALGMPPRHQSNYVERDPTCIFYQEGLTAIVE